MKYVTTILICVLLALTTLVGTVEAQRNSGRRGSNRLDSKERELRHQFVEQVVAELQKSVGDKLQKENLARFERMARSVVRGLKKDDFKALSAKPIAEQVKAVAAIWSKSREDAAQRFIKKQTPQVAAELNGMDRKTRDQRIVELKVLATLEKSISSAEKLQLIEPAESDRLRGLPSTEQIKESHRLNRLVFFAMHGAEIDAKERARLEKLSSRDFWRDRTVRRRQLLLHIDAKELAALRKLDGKSRMKLFKGLRTGKGLEAFVETGTLSKKTAEKWAGMNPESRRRVLRDLMRVHLPQRGRSIGLSRKQMSSLTHEERRQLGMMNIEERLKFLKTRFPDEDWDKREAHRKLRGKIEKELGNMDRRSRYRLRTMMPASVEGVLKKAFPQDEAKVKRLLREMEQVDWFRSVVPAARELRSQLSSEERKAMPTMNTESRVDFLFTKFPERLNKEASSQLAAAKIEAPKNWEAMTGSAKVEFLNQRGLHMPWSKAGSSRWRRGGRGPGGKMREGRGPGGKMKNDRPLRRRSDSDKPRR